MARFGAGEPINGLLTLEQVSEHRAVLRFAPTERTRRDLRLESHEFAKPIKLVELDCSQNRVRTFPIETLPRREMFGSPKYQKIRVISVDMEVSEFPLPLRTCMTCLRACRLALRETANLG